MKVELEIEEAREILLFVADRLAKEAGLDDKDRAALSKWKTGMTPGSEGMRELAAKINADVARSLENQKRSLVRKPDWR
ncbi:MAG TPA: hypothetical protein VMT90_09825 [Dehalococcoidia bacterium]|jgi:hypothetical protein|nr:hypothetical protein [Dehalococcoidia bacterium]